METAASSRYCSPDGLEYIASGLQAKYPVRFPDDDFLTTGDLIAHRFDDLIIRQISQLESTHFTFCKGVEEVHFIDFRKFFFKGAKEMLTLNSFNSLLSHQLFFLFRKFSLFFPHNGDLKVLFIYRFLLILLLLFPSSFQFN